MTRNKIIGIVFTAVLVALSFLAHSDNSAPEQVVTETASDGNANALEASYTYTHYMGHSRSRLIEDLREEGFSASEAEFAANHCGIDWDVQAERRAVAHLRQRSYSRASLIEQLEYEGFTRAQSVYAVDRVGY